LSEERIEEGEPLLERENLNAKLDRDFGLNPQICPSESRFFITYK